MKELKKLDELSLVYKVLSEKPIKVVGGSSREEISGFFIYVNGFVIYENKDGKFEISSTSALGKSIDGFSYSSLQEAIEKLYNAYSLS